jgi:hypothetical protein
VLTLSHMGRFRNQRLEDCDRPIRDTQAGRSPAEDVELNLTMLRKPFHMIVAMCSRHGVQTRIAWHGTDRNELCVGPGL